MYDDDDRGDRDDRDDHAGELVIVTIAHTHHADEDALDLLRSIFHRAMASSSRARPRRTHGQRT